MIKILAIADLHLREAKPQCRLEEEDWDAVLFGKLNELVDTAVKQKVDYVVIAGDIFDSWGNNSVAFLTKCATFFINAKQKVKIVCISGNHDSCGGNLSELYRTPYALLKSVNAFYEPCDFPDLFSPYYYVDKGKKDIHTPIVIAHKGLYYKNIPFNKKLPSEHNAEWFVAHNLQPECKLLISGDFHTPFIAKINGVTIVNCGSVLRLKADQIDYKPTMKVITISDDWDIKVDEIPFTLHNPIRRDYIDDRYEREERLNTILGEVSGNFEVTYNFKDNFEKIVSEIENGDRLLKLFRSITDDNDSKPNSEH